MRDAMAKHAPPARASPAADHQRAPSVISAIVGASRSAMKDVITHSTMAPGMEIPSSTTDTPYVNPARMNSVTAAATHSATTRPRESSAAPAENRSGHVKRYPAP